MFKENNFIKFVDPNNIADYKWVRITKIDNNGQLSSGLSSIGIDTNGGVAWFAHIGGFIAGVGLLKYFQNFNIE